MKVILQLAKTLTYAVRILSMIKSNNDLDIEDVRKLADEALDEITGQLKPKRTVH